jgi:hypothetical protein
MPARARRPGAVAEDEPPAQHGQRDTGDGAHRDDDAHRAAAQAAVEEVHGGAAAHAGQRALQQVRRVRGAGGDDEHGREASSRPPSRPSKETAAKWTRRDSRPPAKSATP